jgi:hypothetical protein
MDPDQTPFFSDIKELTIRHIIFSLKNIIKLKIWVKILFSKHYFSPLSTFMRKGRIRSQSQIHASD